MTAKPWAAFWPVRVAAGHPRALLGLAAGLVAYLVLPASLSASTRAVLGWDVGGLVLLTLAAVLFAREGDNEAMAENAIEQQEGEWTMFWVTLAGVAFSFVALTHELQNLKQLKPVERGIHVGLVAATLLISWLMTHVVFGLRYAHEFYTSTPGVKQTDSGGRPVDGGLEFPGNEPPDYWDFVYFAIVLGMTFQVSDVQITSRKLRRLATVHGLIGFLFNTVIVALTVNIAAGLLS